MTNRIFNMSGVYLEEGFDIDGATHIDCTDMEGTNCYCSAESVVELRKRIPIASSNGNKITVNWIDTGDYHYLTAILMEEVIEPFELILFDNHPDNQPLAFEEPGMLSCGSWVKWASENNPNLKSRLWVKPERYNTTIGNCKLPVYLSIDLDILRKEDFSTDWDQSDVKLSALLEVLDTILSTRRVLGIDICGGITEAKGAMSCELTANKAVRACLSAKISQYL